MLAIRIPGLEERSGGNTRLATATESIRRHPCSASTLVILCPKQTTRDARRETPFFSFAPVVSRRYASKPILLGFPIENEVPDWTFIHQRPTKEGWMDAGWIMKTLFRCVQVGTPAFKL
jgi:hypothetical protein